MACEDFGWDIAVENFNKPRVLTLMSLAEKAHEQYEEQKALNEDLKQQLTELKERIAKLEKIAGEPW